MSSPMAGGHSAADMTPEVSELTLSLKASIEAELEATFDTFDPVSMTQQVVAGMVYHVKVNVGSEHIHARIFKPLPHTGAAATVQKAQAGFSAEDPIAPL